MTISATVTIEKSTENQQIKIYRASIKKSFGQIPNWLLFKIAQRLPAEKHHAYCLLAYFLSLKSFTMITAKTLAEETGHSERSIYRYLSYLAKIGHVRIIKIKGDDMRFITTVYEVYLDKFFWRDNDTDWQKGENIINNSEKHHVKRVDRNSDWQKGENKQKNDSSYYKNTRARTQNTENNTVNPTDCYSIERKKDRPNRRDFFAAVPIGLRNKDTPKLINCLIKFFKDEAFDFMSWVFCNDTIKEPIGYLWGAISKKQQSLTKPPSVQNPPLNPQKSLAFKEQEKYNQELKTYSDQDMFMQQGQRQEQKKEPGPAAKRIMERMKKMAIEFSG